MKKEEIDELLNDVEEKKKSIELELKSVELERERLAARLREYRKELKMSQQELANILGKNQTVISSWETGSGVPDANQLPKIAKALGVSLGDSCGIPEVKSADQALLDAYHNANETTQQNVRLLLGIGGD